MFMLDVPVERMSDFERELLSYFDGNAREVLTEIREKQTISAELEKRMYDHVVKFKKAFMASLEK
jgi:F-type H+-transporting ATPase subunit alpha